MNDPKALYTEFVAQRRKMAYLDSARSLLDWDMETKMPKNGADARGDVTAVLAEIAHERSTSQAYGDLLGRLREAAGLGLLDKTQCINVERAHRDLERVRKLPADLVSELASTVSKAHHVWAKAKHEKDFKLFSPTLTRIVELMREKGKLVSSGSPYDGLLEEYEPGMSTFAIANVLTPLRSELKPLIERLKRSHAAPDPSKARFSLPKAKQEELCREIAAWIGYPFEGGRLDESEHPFSNRVHPGDLRITTNYTEDDVLDALYSTVHEVGHSLYEGGLPQEHFGLAHGSASSFGLHEANSRLWEQVIGHSLPFCKHVSSVLRRYGIVTKPDRLYRSMNVVRLGPRRLEADEVTYNLHICLRFELERDLIEGRLQVADARDAWNAKTKEFLGVDITNDAEGILQDVHWSAGYFGYFPSYALGNLFSAQIYAAVRSDLPGLDQDVSMGEFAPLHGWLKEHIWQHGFLLNASEIVRRATGAEPSAASWLAYVNKKYGEIYKL